MVERIGLIGSGLSALGAALALRHKYPSVRIECFTHPPWKGSSRHRIGWDCISGGPYISKNSENLALNSWFKIRNSVGYEWLKFNRLGGCSAVWGGVSVPPRFNELVNHDSVSEWTEDFKAILSALNLQFRCTGDIPVNKDVTGERKVFWAEKILGPGGILDAGSLITSVVDEVEFTPIASIHKHGVVKLMPDGEFRGYDLIVHAADSFTAFQHLTKIYADNEVITSIREPAQSICFGRASSDLRLTKPTSGEPGVVCELGFDDETEIYTQYYRWLDVVRGDFCSANPVLPETLFVAFRYHCPSKSPRLLLTNRRGVAASILTNEKCGKRLSFSRNSVDMRLAYGSSQHLVGGIANAKVDGESFNVFGKAVFNEHKLIFAGSSMIPKPPLMTLGCHAMVTAYRELILRLS